MCVSDASGNAPNIASHALAARDRHGAAMSGPCVGWECGSTAAMISRLCEKLEAAMATGDWPSFTQADASSGRIRQCI